MLKIGAGLALGLVTLFLLYVAVVSAVVMLMGIFTASSELTGQGLAGLVCTVVLIVAPVLWYVSRRKRQR